MALSRLFGLAPGVREYADYTIQLGEYYGFKPTITSGYRSIEKQAELYRNRATNPYPVAAPGSSAHNFGLAWDSSVPANQRAAWVAFRRWLGWEVPANDDVHAAVPNWRAYAGR